MGLSVKSSLHFQSENPIFLVLQIPEFYCCVQGTHCVASASNKSCGTGCKITRGWWTGGPGAKGPLSSEASGFWAWSLRSSARCRWFRDSIWTAFSLPHLASPGTARTILVLLPLLLPITPSRVHPR